MTAILTPEEKERVRYHLGYLGTSDAASLAQGLPTSRQTMFLLESALDRLMAVSLPRVQSHLQILDGLEKQMVEAQCALAALELGDLKIRQDHIDALEKEYNRWSGRMADVFGVPRYQYSTRFSASGTGRAGSIKVRG